MANLGAYGQQMIAMIDAAQQARVSFASYRFSYVLTEDVVERNFRSA
jgi:hypothetical protein